MNNDDEHNDFLDEDVVDLESVRSEIDAIRKEALTYGYSLDSDRGLGELRTAIAKIRDEREGKPNCFRRSFLSTAPQCRVCDLASDCAQQDIPEYLAPEDLQSVTCARCQTGTLNVPLNDPASGVTRNYGCSTQGCPQTVLDQYRFDRPELTVEDHRRDAKKPKEDLGKYKQKRERKKAKNGKIIKETPLSKPKDTRWMTSEAIQDMISSLVAQHGTLPTKESVVKLVPAARRRVQKTLDQMVRDGIIRYRKNKGYFPPRGKT